MNTAIAIYYIIITIITIKNYAESAHVAFHNYFNNWILLFEHTVSSKTWRSITSIDVQSTAGKSVKMHHCMTTITCFDYHHQLGHFKWLQTTAHISQMYTRKA